MSKKFDIVVIGAGHAGLEAAFACAHTGLKTALITLREESVGSAPCNPSVGGPAKGVATREIDALGGMQGKAADINQLQIKLLNESKGAGVRALRAQIDKIKYHRWFLNECKKTKNLTLIIDEVNEITIKNSKVCGVHTTKNGLISTNFAIITSGTYMKSVVHIGLNSKVSGPVFDDVNGKNKKTVWSERSNNLSDNIKKLGFELIRLKTGTPPRIYKDSINFKAMEVQPGTNAKLAFEHFNPTYLPFKKQELCWLTYTNAKTHAIIKKNLNKSAMYSGNIKGVGPRYCPSIEDKVVRFSDKPRHQLFIEPESLLMDTYYLQGLSTSLPEDVQEKFVRTIKGLEKARFQRHAYAIEYDAINPTQLWPTLESKKIKGLYFAGQVNGSSGYEEAAAQGMIAGLNASLAFRNKEQIILKRNEAYIGVLIDDLVTKGVTDPYRLLTSRAEHRLSMRNDNADDRLIEYGFYAGTISKKNYTIYIKQKTEIEKVIKYLKTNTVGGKLNKKYGNSSHSLLDLLKRPEVELKEIVPPTVLKSLTPDSINKIEIKVKFEGYIKLQDKEIEKYSKLQNISLKSIKDYKKVTNLSLEARDKLNKIKPLDLSQAQRIQGITTNDIVMIKYFLEKK